jgi:hypothetical protein
MGATHLDPLRVLLAREDGGVVGEEAGADALHVHLADDLQGQGPLPTLLARHQRRRVEPLVQLHALALHPRQDVQRRLPLPPPRVRDD